jgi:2-dehydropantoate 2-reductase
VKIAIIGAGGIGSTFAVQLARAGHAVSVVARNKRLAQLQSRGGVEIADGQRSEVVPLEVSGVLDQTTAWDLVLVSVLASQVDSVLPTLASSAARCIMFMFNTFEPLQTLKAAIGADRFAFGFPSILAKVDAQGILHSSIQAHGMRTTVTDAALADVFSAAGIPAVVSTQMESWLRSHVAAVVPLIMANAAAEERRSGIPWREALELAKAMDEGFELVRKLGYAVTPTPVSVISLLPTVAKAALIWSATRNKTIRENGAAAVGEGRSLLDAMLAAAPEGLPQLRRLRHARA